ADIAKQLALLIAAERPLGENIGIVSPEGQVGAVGLAPTEPRSLNYARQRVEERRQDLVRRGGNQNWFTSVRPVVEDLERTFTRPEDDTRGYHDDYRLAALNIEGLCSRQEIDGDDLSVKNLLAACAEGVFDIRAASPEVAKMVEARAQYQARAPDARTLSAITRLQEEVGEKLDPTFAAEIEQDRARLEAITTPGDTLEDGEAKDRSYRLSTRLAKLWWIGRQPPDRIVIGIDRARVAWDEVAKVVDLINGAKAWADLLPFLI
ncbi:MAG: hypothetical protein AAF713_19255, partial [Pseudomonadota bacterium]